jgi:tRNA threonylcarbamoyladenosine biosynthesis protein TsaB
MILLALETSGTLARIAVTEEATLRAELVFAHERHLARDLAPAILETLELAGLAPRGIEGVAVSAGPGSFTGLRVGVATAKALAFALGVPVAGISTLQALAWEAGRDRKLPICAVLPASPQELYASCYAPDFTPLFEHACATLPELLERLPEPPFALAGEGGALNDALERAAAGRAPWRHRGPPRALTVARLALPVLRSGGEPVHSLTPLYLRASTPEVRLRARGAASPATGSG